MVRLQRREFICEFYTIVRANYAESSNVYDSLGEAYMKSGQKQLTIENYKKSLEKDPKNDHAKQKLKELATSKQGAK